jgi:hypothetical protein
MRWAREGAEVLRNGELLLSCQYTALTEIGLVHQYSHHTGATLLSPETPHNAHEIIRVGLIHHPTWYWHISSNSLRWCPCFQACISQVISSSSISHLLLSNWAPNLDFLEERE